MRWQGVVDGEATKGVEGEARGKRERGLRFCLRPSDVEAKSLVVSLLGVPPNPPSLPPATLRRPIGSHLIPTNVSLQDTRLTDTPIDFTTRYM